MAFAEWWEDIAGFGAEQMTTMKAASYYSTLAMPRLRIISINGNYGLDL